MTRSDASSSSRPFPQPEQTRRLKSPVERRRLATAMRRPPVGLSVAWGGIPADERDPSTGLAMRAMWLQSLQGELARHDLEGGGVAVVCVRVAHPVSGEELSDAVLQTVARICVRSTRFTDLVGRTDRCRFAMLLQQAGRDGASSVIERVIRRLRRIALAGVPLSVHTGYAALDEAAGRAVRSAEALLRCAWI